MHVDFTLSPHFHLKIWLKTTCGFWHCKVEDLTKISSPNGEDGAIDLAGSSLRLELRGRIVENGS